MKYIVFAFGLFFIIQSSFCQEIDWKNTDKWTLYSIPGKGAFTYRADTLLNFKNITLDDDRMKNYLLDAKIWPTEKYSMWMGTFVTSFVTNKKKIQKLIISSYGGFVYDPEQKRYYEIMEENRVEWYKYINEKSEQLNLK